jgi:hypothetical protein
MGKGMGMEIVILVVEQGNEVSDTSDGQRDKDEENRFGRRG